jgi:hypothetical protein
MKLETESTENSYWQMCQLIFVLFSLYLTGDAIYRWDGYRYYASFSDFLPSLALIMVLWSLLAFCLAFITWLFLRAVDWFCLSVG